MEEGGIEQVQCSAWTGICMEWNDNGDEGDDNGDEYDDNGDKDDEEGVETSVWSKGTWRRWDRRSYPLITPTVSSSTNR